MTTDRGATGPHAATSQNISGQSRIQIGHGHCCAHQVLKPPGQTAADTKTRLLDAADEIFVLAGSCLFPFAARPMIAEVLGLSPTRLRELMKRRRRELPAFLSWALQP